MTYPTPTCATLNDWIAHEAIPFSLASLGSFNAAIDTLIASLGNSVELLGLGEALHGGEDILLLRNQLFQHLVERRILDHLYSQSNINFYKNSPLSKLLSPLIHIRVSSPCLCTEKQVSFSYKNGK